MFKLFVVTRSEGNVATSIVEFDDKSRAETALIKLEDFDSGLDDWKVLVIRLY